jgi:hypothetical protein
MPSTTNISPVIAEGSRASLPPPRVVRSATDASFLSRKGVLTVPQAKTPDETMIAECSVVPIPRLIRSPEPGSERFTPLQKWDGVVLDADAETFTARLFDSHGEFSTQQATFSRSELSPEEETQIAVGASFVWTIGYRHIGTTRHRDSTIYFRRLPPWSEDELKSARDRAEKVSTAIGWK